MDCCDLQRVVSRVAERGTINVRVDGPYGYSSEPEWTLYDTVIMVAGGIGVKVSLTADAGHSVTL